MADIRSGCPRKTVWRGLLPTTSRRLKLNQTSPVSLLLSPLTLTLRRETRADDAFLRRLFAAIRADDLSLQSWPNDAREALLSSQFEFQQRHYREHYPSTDFMIVQRDSAPIGRCCLDRANDAWLLLDLLLLPEHRGQGVGTILLQRLLNEAGHSLKPLRLQIEISNRAQSFYQRLGFRCLEDDGIYRLMEWLPRQLHGRESL